MNRPKFYSKAFRVQQIQTIKDEKESTNNLVVGGQNFKESTISNSSQMFSPQTSQIFRNRPYVEYQQRIRIQRIRKPTAVSDVILQNSTVSNIITPIPQSIVRPARQIQLQKSFQINDSRVRSQKQFNNIKTNRFVEEIDRGAKSQSNSPEKKRNRKDSSSTLISQSQKSSQIQKVTQKVNLLGLEKEIQIQKINTEVSDNEEDSNKTFPLFDPGDKDESDRSFMEESKNTDEDKRVPIIQFSQFPNRPATFFFQYPSICEQRRNLVRTRKMTEQEIKKYRPTYRVLGQVPYKCVIGAFEQAGFKVYEEEEEDGDWNVHWGMGSKTTHKNMNRYQRINHFPGCWNLGRKDNLWMNLSKMKRKFPKDYDFFPNTYLLSYDYDRFIANRESASKSQLWILKPCAAARGKGIKMISKKTKITKKKGYLIMDYISHPHLINNFKYDLRIYVLVSGFDPLRVYIYNEGLVRFATQAYSVSHKDLSKKYIHLTNFSVNKKSPAFIKNQNSNQDDFGSKWSLTALRKKFEQIGVNHNLVFERISDVVVKTIIAAEPFMLDLNAKTSEHRNSYFELYGFDILLDQDLKPWILEVNVCPSLNSSSPLDKRIKTALICDIMHLVGVPLWDKSKSISTITSPGKQTLFSKNLNEICQINHSNCLQKLNGDDWNNLLNTKEQQSRCGNFRCIFPVSNTIQYYNQFFELQRYNNRLIERFFEDGERWLERLKM